MKTDPVDDLLVQKSGVLIIMKWIGPEKPVGVLLACGYFVMVLHKPVVLCGNLMLVVFAQIGCY